MSNFQFYNPAQVVFGPGTLARVGESVCRFGNTALLVTGCVHTQSGKVLNQAVQTLESSKVRTTVVEGVKPNPKLADVVQITKGLHSKKFDCIVALGGGSVMDAAKLISLILTHENDPWEYRVTGSLSVSAISDSLIPVITVPTTAGTGSEISPAALATHQSRKEVFFSPHMYPKVAIIDPALAVSLPVHITAQVGMDAFVQSMEAYVSVAAQPFSDMFATESMRLVHCNLASLLSRPDDIELRSKVALAGFLSCYAIGQAGVGAVHALSDPLSGRYDIGHGLALSIILPSVMRANLDSNPQKFASVGRLLGVDTSGMSLDNAAAASVAAVEKLLEALGLAKHRLSDFGVQRGDLSVLAEEAENPDMATNPKKLTMEAKMRIYSSSL